MLNKSNYKISQGFGLTSYALSDAGRKLYRNFKDIDGKYLGHPGVDIVGDLGIPAMYPANVVQSGSNGTWGTSITTYDTHFYRLFAHLEASYVLRWDNVASDQEIAKMGKTGSANNIVHLHYSKYHILDDGRKIYVDPTEEVINYFNKSMYDNKIIRISNGSLAYVKGDKKQIITAKSAGFAVLTWLVRIESGKFPSEMYKDVSNSDWNSLKTVPDGTWF